MIAFFLHTISNREYSIHSINDIRETRSKSSLFLNSLEGSAVSALYDIRKCEHHQKLSIEWEISKIEKQILRCASRSGMWNSKVRKLDKVSIRLHITSAKTFRIWAFVTCLCSRRDKIYARKHCSSFSITPFSFGQRNFRSSLRTEIEDLALRLIFARSQRDCWEKFALPLPIESPVEERTKLELNLLLKWKRNVQFD